MRPRRLLRLLSDFDYKIRYHPEKASIHEAQVEALKKGNVKDENRHAMDKEFENRLDGTLCIRRRISPMARYGSRHRHLYQQMLDVFKDEGQLSEAIKFTGTTRNTPLEMENVAMDFITRLPKKTSSTTLFGCLALDFSDVLCGVYVQYDIIFQWKNPTSTISDQTIANLKAKLVENEVVRVMIPKCMSWLDAYDEPIGDIEDKVDNPSPHSTPQVLSSFEVYTPPMTYPEEVEGIIGILIEVEPLDETPLEDLGLNTCNHDIPLSSREIPNFDERDPQPQPLPSCPSLDISLREERGLESPIKPHSPDSFRIKVVDNLTIHIPPSPHVASLYPKDVYCYYHPYVEDPKKYYGFKPGLLGHSGSLGVDLSNWEMIEDDWQLEPKEVSFLGRRLNLPVRPKELENVRIKETHHLEHINQQPIFQHVTPSHNNGFYAVLSSDLTNKIACRKFLIKNEERFFTVPGDGVRIKPEGVASPAM
ncbi:hypothetical protein Tco_1283858 [Tanacetum coccineum]